MMIYDKNKVKYQQFLLMQRNICNVSAPDEDYDTRSHLLEGQQKAGMINFATLAINSVGTFVRISSFFGVR